MYIVVMCFTFYVHSYCVGCHDVMSCSSEKHWMDVSCDVEGYTALYEIETCHWWLLYSM